MGSDADPKLYNGRLLVYQNDLNKPCDQQSNVTPPKMPPDIAKAIDESNYVKLSSITTAIAGATDLNNGNMRMIHRNEPTPNGKPVADDLHESDKINELDSKANILNNFYANTNGFNNNSKTIMSLVNQKNLNNLNNIFNHNTNTNPNTNNMLNNSDFTKLNLTNGGNGGGAIDYNQNGLPAIPNAPPLPGSVAQVPCDSNTNKCNAPCNGNSQAYVINSNSSNDVVNGEDALAVLTNDPTKGRC